MNKKVIAGLVLVLLPLVVFDYLGAWTAPGAEPTSGNVAAPLHTGDATQIKDGGLGVDSLDVAGGAVVRGSASSTDLDLAVLGRVGAREYCDENGLNCVTTAGGGLGGGDDTITIGGVCFEPAKAIVCNWNWSGDGNEDSTYIQPMETGDASFCSAQGRSYRRTDVILAQCFPDYTYAWQIGTYGSCRPTSFLNTCSTTGVRTRTVVCRRSDGMTVGDSLCPAPKPATSQSCTRSPSGDC